MFEAFSVAVRLRLVDSVTGGLMGLSRHFAMANGQASELQTRLARIGRTAAVGTAMTGAGLAILASLRPAVDEAKKFQTEVARFQTFGLSDALNADAVRFVKTTKVVGASYTDLMRNMVEAQGVFRESGLNGPEALAGAKLAVPVLARIHFANAALSPEEQGRRDASGLQMVRFIEMRGGLGDARKFNEIADAGFKAIQSSGGNVNWEQFRQFMATGGVSAQGLSNTALFGQLEPIIGELKGGRTGTALMTAYNRIEGLTRVPNQVAHELVKQGVWDGSKITWNSQGGIKTINGNPLRDAATFAGSPVDFYQRTLLPMYDRMRLDQAGINRENTLIFGRTGGAMFSLIDRALRTGTIQGSVASQAKALGVNASVSVAANTVAGQEAALHADFKNVLINVGMAALPVLSRLLTAITPMLQGLSDWAVAHPLLFDGLIRGLIALGAALVVGGAVVNLVATAQALKLLYTTAKEMGVFTEAVAMVKRLWPIIAGAVRAALASATEFVGSAFPAIGAAIEGLAATLGISVGALAGTVAIGAAAAAAIGFAIYEIVKHWDASKSVWWNIKNEFSEFLNWFSGLSKKAINLLPKPMQMPVAVAAADATGGLTDGTFVARMKAVGAVVSPLLSTLKAVADGLSSHVRSWFDFGLHLVGAFGRVHDAITGFLARMLAIPGQWVAAHIPKLPDIHIPGFAPAAAAPAKGGKPAPAGGPKATLGSVVKLVLVGGIPGLIKASWSALPSNDKIRSGLAGASFLDAPKAAGNWLDSILPAKGQAHMAGQGVGHGVAAGIVAAHPAVRAAAKGTASQAVTAFKVATDQHSPSRVFAALGDMLVAGLIMGVDRTAPNLLSRLADLGRSAAGSAQGSLQGFSAAGAGLTQKLTSSVADRASQAMAFFKAHGWSGAQAAGIVANLVRESGLNYTAVNARSGAYGITQWLGARVRNFAAFTGHALQGSSLLQQLAFTDHELRTTHAKVGRALMMAQTPGAAAALINDRFEINGLVGEGERRGALASQLASLVRPPPTAMRFGTMPPLAPTPAQPTRSPYVAKAPQHVVVHTRTVLDGRVLSETVTRHQAHEASRPHAGVSTYDHTMSPAPVGLGYHP